MPNLVQPQVGKLCAPNIFDVESVVVVDVSSQTENALVLCYQIDFVGREETTQENTVCEWQATPEKLRASEVRTKALMERTSCLRMMTNEISVRNAHAQPRSGCGTKPRVARVARLP